MTMRGRTTLWMTIGAGLALWLAYDRQRRQVQVRRWAQKRPALALITGASSGIGEAFARNLAREGYDLILVARRKERLQALAEEIRRETASRSETPSHVEVWAADLNDPIELESVEQRIAALENLDLLVNNAGFGLTGRFAEKDIRVLVDMVQVHVVATMRLVRAALPGMIRRGRGGVINVSSISALLPVGGNTVYGATKAYLNFFTESLALELKDTGVRVQALCPGFTVSEFHDRIGRPTLPRIFWMSPEQVVEEALRGLRENQLYVIPGLLYKVGAALMINPLVAPFIRGFRSLVTRQLVDR
jgi:short-subunit dehydrogenase